MLSLRQIFGSPEYRSVASLSLTFENKQKGATRLFICLMFSDAMCRSAVPVPYGR